MRTPSRRRPLRRLLRFLLLLALLLACCHVLMPQARHRPGPCFSTSQQHTITALAAHTGQPLERPAGKPFFLAKNHCRW